jgi:predicted PurR-regulated permease PerM
MTAQRYFIFWGVTLSLLVALLYVFSDVLLPFVLGMVFAYLLNPAVNLMGRWKIQRGPAAFAIVVIFVALVVAAAGIILPIVYGEIVQLSQQLPEYFERLRALTAPAVDRLESFLGRQDRETVQTMMGEHAGTAAGVAATLAGGIAQGGKALLSLLGLFVITPFVTFYMMKEWKVITGWVTALLPRPHEHVILGLFHEIDRKLSGFIRGQALVALFLGVAYAIALSIVGLRYGFLIGLASGFLSIIPMVGSVTGFVVGVLVAWLQTGELHFVITVAAIFLIGQMIEGNFLTPKIVGDRVGLHPLWVFFALMAGAALFGFLGMLIAVPVAAVISVLAAFSIKRYKASPYYKGPR